jgi:isopenicillin-N epimerase
MKRTRKKEHDSWLLEPDICFLNHGSFGATPKIVLEYQNQLRGRLEAEPVRFFAQEWEGLLDDARNKLARFLNIEANNLAFVPNATTGVNTVLRSLFFQPGDELLITDHVYNACRNAAEFMAKRTGAKIAIASIPFPLKSSQEIVNAILAKVSSKTKLVLIDHVTSPTALIFPIKEIVDQLNQLGIDSLIDGAHAPGFISLDLQAINATYYTGNCHKWLCAPKGSGFLYVRPDKQAEIRPLSISHGANSSRKDRSRFLLEFDWTGTDDYSPYFCIPKAIDFLGSLLPGGWEELRANNHTLALEARKILCNSLNIKSPCPDELIGAMASLPLKQTGVEGEGLQVKLMQEYQIEVPVIPWFDFDHPLLRISVQFYNRIEDYKYLAEVLSKI